MLMHSDTQEMGKPIERLQQESHATTRYKGKEIAKPITPPSESASEEDSDSEVRLSDDSEHKAVALVNDDITMVKGSPLTSKDVLNCPLTAIFFSAATDTEVAAH
ncbi:hypothetical protein Tco_0404786 [Tanacetum coccineum]